MGMTLDRYCQELVKRVSTGIIIFHYVSIGLTNNEYGKLLKHNEEN
jgi:hypothetical protein